MRLVYFGAYCLALLVFASVVQRRLQGVAFGSRLLLTSVVAYVAGMFHFAHGFFFPCVEGSLSHPGADALWNRIAEDGLSLQALLSAGGGLWGGALFVLALTLAPLAFVRWPLDSKLAALDAVALALPFALAVCKTGCFAVGCCYGIESHGPWALTNTWGAEGAGVPRIPTQLLDFVALMAIGVGLSRVGRRAPSGRLLPWFVLLYAVSRGATELVRGDTELRGALLLRLILILGAALACLALARPRAWERLWAWRTTPTPSPRAPSPEAFVWWVISGTVLQLPQALFVPLFGTLLVLRRHDTRRVVEAALGLGLGLLWLTATLLPTLIPFAVTAIAFALFLPWALERDRRGADAAPHGTRDGV